MSLGFLLSRLDCTFTAPALQVYKLWVDPSGGVLSIGICISFRYLLVVWLDIVGFLFQPCYGYSFLPGSGTFSARIFTCGSP